MEELGRTAKAMGFSTSGAQQRKVAGQSCVVCWQTPCDPAHLIPRSIKSDPTGDPLRVVPLCRKHHDAYDRGDLDLLPYLTDFHREVAFAVEQVGLIIALERITNRRWVPAIECLRCRRGTVTGPNGESQRCLECGGSGKVTA